MKSKSHQAKSRFVHVCWLLTGCWYLLLCSSARSGPAEQLEAYKAELAAGRAAAQGQKLATVVLFSDYVEVAVAANGNFTMGTRLGDPDNLSDDNLRMLFGHPDVPTGATTLRVDGTDYWNLGDTTQIGELVEGPATMGGTNSTVWSAGGIRFTQNLQLLPGSSGREDALRMKCVAENTDTAAHEVGVRIFLDTQLGDNDGAPFRIPGIGDVQQELDLSGDMVPETWQSFDDLANPTIQTQGTLVGFQATRPDRAVWANWGRLNDAPFDFVPESIAISDSAVALYWNPVSLQPGQTATYVSYYGLGDIKIVQADLSLGLSGPGTLTLDGDVYVPNPFTVTLFVGNNRPDATDPAVNVMAEISLPQGLQLAAGETTVHALGDLPVGALSQTSWQVYATGDVTGLLTYGVDVSADNIPSTHLDRPVTVPSGGTTPTVAPTPTVSPTPVPPGEGPTLHAGFEQGVSLGSGIAQSSVAIGDIDQDGRNELVVGGFGGGLYAYNGDGTPVLEPGSDGLAFGQLFQTPDGSPILSSPTLADVDSDRRLDILWGTDGGEVYRLELRLETDPPVEAKGAGMLKVWQSGHRPRLKRIPAPGEDDDVGR